MKLKNISYGFVWYLALIEGLALMVLNYYPGAARGFLVGFIPAFIVLNLYRFTAKYIPVKVNSTLVSNLPIIRLSVVNGAFIVILFLIQQFMPVFPSVWYEAVYGFASVMLSVLLMILVYNIFSKRKISYLLALYAGLFEFFILPLMFVFYQLQWAPFAVGSTAGLIGGSIALFITNKIVKKKPILF